MERRNRFMLGKLGGSGAQRRQIVIIVGLGGKVVGACCSTTPLC